MTPSAATKGKNITVIRIQREFLKVEVVGLAPGLLTSRIPEDALLPPIGPKGGKKIQLPAEEVVLKALYCLDPVRDGAQFGFPAIAFERAIVASAMRFTSLKGTELRGTFQVIPGSDGYLPIRDREWIMARHDGRNKSGGLIKLIRPLFMTGWRMTLPIEFNPDLISDENLINLLNLAGFYIGIGAFRPEKKGPYGRFEVCGEAQVE